MLHAADQGVAQEQTQAGGQPPLSRKVTDGEPGRPLRSTCARIHGPARPLTPTRSLHTCSCMHFLHMQHLCTRPGGHSHTNMRTHTLSHFLLQLKKTTVRFENRIFSSRPTLAARAGFFQAFLATRPSRSLAHNLHRGGLGSPAVPHAPAPKLASVFLLSPPSSVPDHCRLPIDLRTVQTKPLHVRGRKMGLG